MKTFNLVWFIGVGAVHLAAAVYRWSTNEPTSALMALLGGVVCFGGYWYIEMRNR